MDIAQSPETINFISRPFVAMLILLAGLGISLLVWQDARTRVHDQAAAEFGHLADFSAREIEREIQRYSDFLYDIRLMFSASPDSVKGSFDRYAETARGSTRHPGLVELFFTPHETGPQLPHTGHSFMLPLAPRHRDSFEQARDTGIPVATGPVPAIRGKLQKTAVIWYLPLYRTGEKVLTVDDRRRAFLGVINGVVLVDEMIRTGQLHSMNERLGLRIYDHAAPGSSAVPVLLYDDTRATANTSHGFAKTVYLNVGARNWELQFRSRPGVGARGTNRLALPLLVAGLLCTLLIYLLARSLFLHQKSSR